MGLTLKSYDTNRKQVTHWKDMTFNRQMGQTERKNGVFKFKENERHRMKDDNKKVSDMENILTDNEWEEWEILGWEGVTQEEHIDWHKLEKEWDKMNILTGNKTEEEW